MNTSLCRIITNDKDPQVENDLEVQQRLADGSWVKIKSFNTLSNDWAHQSAQELLEKLTRDQSKR